MSPKPPPFSFWEFLFGGFTETFDVYFVSFLFICGVLLLLIFPFYVHVNRKNRERDKESLVFPITNSFYQMMKVFYILFVLEQLNYPLWFYTAYKANIARQKYLFDVIPILGTFRIFRALGIIFDSASIGINHAFQFFLSILAIQKFIIYFFPHTQKYIELTKAKMRIGIYFVYILFGLKRAVVTTRNLFCVEKKALCLKLGPLEYISDTAAMSFLSMNVLFITTAFLYLPIMRSVSRHSSLRSFKENQPQKYILWQTLAVLLSKVSFIPIYIWLRYQDKEPIDNFWYFNKFDNFTAPLTMQVSHLGCNKKNLEVVYWFFKRKDRVRGVERMDFERSTNIDGGARNTV